MLQPVGRGVPHFLGQLPAVLPVGTREQPAQVGTRAIPQLGAAEVRGEPGVHRGQFVGPGVGELLIERMGQHVLLTKAP